MDIEEATIIRDWLSECKNKMILDVCSGDPKAPSRPHRWNLLYQPILDNGNVIRSLDKTIFKEGNTPFPQIVSDAECMTEVKSKLYDFVLFTSGIEHLHSPGLALLEVQRILKDDGRAFVSVPGSFPNHGGYDNNIRIQSEKEWKAFLNTMHEEYCCKWIIEKFIKGKWYINASNQRGWQSMVILRKDI